MENKKYRENSRKISLLITKLFFRVEFKGEKELPDTGGYIVCANHKSLWDIPLLANVTKKRWLYFMAKQELFKNPILRWFMNKNGAFPVNRGKGDIGSIKKALTLVKKGNVLGLFPQGTRQKPGQIVPPKKGAALLVAMSNVKIVPVLIEGDMKLFSKVNVIVGKPFDLGLNKGKKYSNEDYINKSQEIMDKIYSLSEVYK